MDSMSLYPWCTLDGRFLFKFYICHPANWRYNVVNQRYWLQLHSRSYLTSPCSSSDTHLVRPTDTSDSYVARHKLMPFRKWLNICHQDTYIHGPSILLPFVVAKTGIALPNPTGTSYINIAQCSTTQSRDLTFQLTQFIAIAAHT